MPGPYCVPDLACSTTPALEPLPTRSTRRLTTAGNWERPMEAIRLRPDPRSNTASQAIFGCLGSGNGISAGSRPGPVAQSPLFLMLVRAAQTSYVVKDSYFPLQKLRNCSWRAVTGARHIMVYKRSTDCA